MGASSLAVMSATVRPRPRRRRLGPRAAGGAEGRRRRRGAAQRGARPRRRVRRAPPRPGRPSWDADGLADAMHELAAIYDLAGRAGLLRDARLHARHHRPGARRADAEGARAGRGDRDPAAVLRARVEQAARRARRGAARSRRARLLPPPPAQPAPLPPAPAERARGAGDDRARRDRLVGLPAPLHRAALVDRRRAARPRGAAPRSRWR